MRLKIIIGFIIFVLLIAASWVLMEKVGISKGLDICLKQIGNAIIEKKEIRYNFDDKVYILKPEEIKSNLK